MQRLWLVVARSPLGGLVWPILATKGTFDQLEVRQHCMVEFAAGKDDRRGVLPLANGEALVGLRSSAKPVI
jgi:hypothetical protein